MILLIPLDGLFHRPSLTKVKKKLERLKIHLQMFVHVCNFRKWELSSSKSGRLLGKN
jgi:hypothetical protein